MYTAETQTTTQRVLDQNAKKGDSGPEQAECASRQVVGPVPSLIRKGRWLKSIQAHIQKLNEVGIGYAFPGRKRSVRA